MLYNLQSAKPFLVIHRPKAALNLMLCKLRKQSTICNRSYVQVAFKPVFFLRSLLFTCHRVFVMPSVFSPSSVRFRCYDDVWLNGMSTCMAYSHIGRCWSVTFWGELDSHMAARAVFYILCVRTKLFLSLVFFRGTVFLGPS